MKNIKITIWNNKTRATTDHLLINNLCILSREMNISANSMLPKWRLEHGSRRVMQFEDRVKIGNTTCKCFHFNAAAAPPPSAAALK